MPLEPFDTGRLLLSLLGMAAIVAAAYYAARLIGARALRVRHGRMIRVLEQVSVSRDKMLCLIECCGNFYLIALSEGGAVLLDRLERDAAAACLKDALANRPGMLGFFERSGAAKGQGAPKNIDFGELFRRADSRAFFEPGDTPEKPREDERR